MDIVKMIKIEKIVRDYRLKSTEMNNDFYKQVLDICDLVNFKLLSTDIDYIKRALLIPFEEIKEHIDYYMNTSLEEKDKLYYFDVLSIQYNLPVYLVIKRFNDVLHLCTSKNKRKELFMMSTKLTR